MIFHYYYMTYIISYQSDNDYFEKMNPLKWCIMNFLKFIKFLFFVSRLTLTLVLAFTYTCNFIIANLFLAIFSFACAIDLEPIPDFIVYFLFVPLCINSFIINCLRVIKLGRYHIIVPIIIIIISVSINALFRLVLSPEEFSLFPLLGDFVSQLTA